MLSKRLRTARTKAKLTQEELGRKVNTTKGTISNYENGHSTPSNEMLLLLSNALNTTTDYLLGRENNPLHIENEVDNEILFRKWAKDSETGAFFSEILESEEAEIEELREIWEIVKKRREKS